MPPLSFARSAVLALAATMAFAVPAAAEDRRCIVCPRPIAQDGRAQYYTIDGTKYWLHVDDQDPGQCRYCGGLMTPSTPWGAPMRYADGRVVCRRCVQNAIRDERQGQAVLDGVRATMEGWGMKFAWGRIPVKIVDQATLTGLVASRHPGLKPDGVCQPRLKKPVWSKTWQVDDLTIYMLDALPRIEFEETAAHELTHAWMALEGCPTEKMTAPFKEGACNLTAYFYLQTRETPEARKLGHDMLRNDDPVYGIGFRRHVEYAKKHRVSGMLRLLKTATDFPPGY